MPRRHRSARDRPGPPAPAERPLGGAAPGWAEAPGFLVRAVSGEKGKSYRCPGCDHLIRPGLPHLVVVPEAEIEARRHWHSPCWRTELRRLGLA